MAIENPHFSRQIPSKYIKNQNAVGFSYREYTNINAAPETSRDTWHIRYQLQSSAARSVPQSAMGEEEDPSGRNTLSFVRRFKGGYKCYHPIYNW